MRIRLKNPEIQQLTGLSRATVWRLVKNSTGLNKDLKKASPKMEDAFFYDSK